MFSTAMYVRANWRMKAKVLRFEPFATAFLASGRLKRDGCRVEVLSIGNDLGCFNYLNDGQMPLLCCMEIKIFVVRCGCGEFLLKNVSSVLRTGCA